MRSVEALGPDGGPCRARHSNLELRFESCCTNGDGASAERRSRDLAFPIAAGRPAREFILIRGCGGGGMAAAGCQGGFFNKEMRELKPAGRRAAEAAGAFILGGLGGSFTPQEMMINPHSAAFLPALWAHKSPFSTRRPRGSISSRDRSLLKDDCNNQGSRDGDFPDFPRRRHRPHAFHSPF